MTAVDWTLIIAGVATLVVILAASAAHMRISRASAKRKQAEAKAYGWREFALDGPQDFDDEPEWYGHDCIAHNICPLHPGQTATDCAHGCTWLAAEPFRPAADADAAYFAGDADRFIPRQTRREP